MIRTIVFSIVFLSAIGFFLYSINKFINLLKRAKPENRFDNIPTRIKNVIKFSFLQTKLLREKLAGILHLLLYWGFVTLSIVILESIFEGFIPGFSFSFLGRFYSILTVTQDLFGALVFFTALFSLFRRYIGYIDYDHACYDNNDWTECSKNLAR
jgi:hypothetical protein